MKENQKGMLGSLGRERARMLVRLVIVGVIFVAMLIFPVRGNLNIVLGIGLYLFIAYDILLRAGKGILRGEITDENFLMSVASLGALALGFYEGTGDFHEAIAVIFFYQIGEFFQDCAVDRSQKNIEKLMDIRPDYAHVERGDELCTVSPEEVSAGSIIVVQPGEKIPLDGIVVQGESISDTSALTGESMPRSVRSGDTVTAGCINLRSPLRIRTTCLYKNSTVCRILQLVRNASEKKSHSERFITKLARVYTPLVCSAALLLAVLPPIILLLSGQSAAWQTWFYRALIFLVISCPCALVLSIPLSFFAGIGAASRAGILIKGSQFLELLAKCRVAVFDKTGTLTCGRFDVEAVHHSPYSESELLQLAAAAECASSHPISLSLRRACKLPHSSLSVTNIQELQGLGVIATVNGQHVAVGNDKLMVREHVTPLPCHKVGTLVHVAVNHRYAGHIVVTDALKPTSARALTELKKLGIQKTIILTGDNRRVAEAAAAELMPDAVHSELLPTHKVEKIEELMRADNELLFFVGDGVNDAPVLARADVGIAMGALGSDAAVEAADVVIMNDDPACVPLAVRLARKCLRTVHQNIIFALGVKILCLLLGAFGMASMEMAIFADVGVLILCVLNAVK